MPGSCLPFLRRDDADELRGWLDAGGSLEGTDRDGSLTGTPAEFAAYHGRLKCLRLLADRGANLDRALALAIHNRQTDVVEFLRSRGVQPAELPPLTPQFNVVAYFEPGLLSLEELDLSVRASNCLEADGITTAGAICERTAEELLEVRNFGETTLVEVREKLAQHGLTLRGE